MHQAARAGVEHAALSCTEPDLCAYACTCGPALAARSLNHGSRIKASTAHVHKGRRSRIKASTAHVHKGRRSRIKASTAHVHKGRRCEVRWTHRLISAPSRSSMSCESVMNCTPRVAASSSRLGLLGWNYGNESSNSWFRVQVRVQVRVRVRVQVRVRVRVQVRIRVVSPTCVAHLLDHLETSLASSSSLGLLLPSLSAGPTGLDWTWLDFLGPAIRTIRDWRRAFMLFSTSPPSIRVTGALWPAASTDTQCTAQCMRAHPCMRVV